MNDEKENVDLEEVNENNTSEVGDETTKQQEDTKTYSEEEVEAIRKQINEDNQKAWNIRWGQEKTKMEKQFAKEKELSELLQKQTNTKDIDELLNMSYEQYGIERPNITNSKDEEVLGKYDAKEILELDDKSIEEEANRLAGRKRTAREEATFLELGKYLTNKKREAKKIQEIKENGIDENILDNQDFKEFASNFKDDISIKNIYEIYSKMQDIKEKSKEKPFNAGSLKGKKYLEEKEYFTEEEFEKLTREDLKDPKIYAKAMKSRIRFN